MMQIKPTVWASKAMVERAGCGAEGFLYLEGPDIDADVPLYDKAAIESLQQLLADARTFVAFAYANGVVGAEECGRRIEAATTGANA